MGGTARAGGEEGISPNPALSPPPPTGRVGAPALQCWGGEGCSKSPFPAGVLGQPPHAGGTWGGFMSPGCPCLPLSTPAALKPPPAKGSVARIWPLGVPRRKPGASRDVCSILGGPARRGGHPAPLRSPSPPPQLSAQGRREQHGDRDEEWGKRQGLAPAASLPGQSKGRAQHGVGCFSFPKPQGGPEPRPPRHGGDKVPGASAAASLCRCAELCLAARMAASTPG